MKKTSLFLILFSLIFINGFAQKNLWKVTSENEMRLLQKMDRGAMPISYKLFALNFNDLKAELSNVPLENLESNIIINFPDAYGKLNNYKIYEAPVMDIALANKFPDLKSYIGKGIDDPSASIRFSVTMFGLHVMSLSGNSGMFYIDTYTKDLNNYIVYNRSDISNSNIFNCMVSNDEIANKVEEATTSLVNDGFFRQYRLAMACTIEYAAFHVNAAGQNGGTLAQKKAAVLSAMVVTMARVNGLYERDMAVRMNLIANNDAIIFIDSDDFTNEDGFVLLGENQTVINTIIGTANYDIGHVVSTGGGGVATLNSPCTGSKARGVTGLPSPVGDAFDIDYVAHEMGHQFGAQHTYNNSCGGNISTSTSAEPGSGSTIMAYAGICAPNVQNNSDVHFHAVSIAQMTAFVLGTGGTCDQASLNGNNAPVVNAGPDYTIPKGTPFILKPLSVTDANNDALTYCWEQTDIQVSTQPPLQTATNGPNFRSLPPTSAQERYMPVLSSVLANNLAPTWEVISTVGRTFNFALTVRDNRTPNGGQTNRDNMIVTVSGTAGPFDVTSQNTSGITWQQGETKDIIWTVNGANTLAGSANVDILLSTDGGLTFPTVLAAAVPNDGLQSITVPNVTSQTCRVMVKPTGNIYYDINTTNFLIGYTITTVCNTYSMNTPFALPDGASGFTTRQIAVPSSPNLISDVNITLNITHPNLGNITASFAKPSTAAATLFSASCVGSANMNVTFDGQGSALTCASPTQGNYLPTSTYNMNLMNGTTQQGNWNFAFRDNVAGQAGTVNSITLDICTQLIQLTLANDSFTFENLSVYPNPNDGTFNVQFNSSTNDKIAIGVYDMRGREIFNKSYQNNGLFSETLQLKDIQSGMYLVTILDGDRKITKKIIVE